MNIVFIEHPGCMKEYAFEVPHGVELKKGENVMLSTALGDALGVCICDSFELDGTPLEVVGRIIGAKFPLRKVIGRVHIALFDMEASDER